MSRFQSWSNVSRASSYSYPPQTITHPNLQFQKQEVLFFGLKDIHQLENVGMLHPEDEESHKVKENNAHVWFIYSKERQMSTVIA